MSDLWLWLKDHPHGWQPVLIVVGVMANGIWGGKRWPKTGQWMHLFACACSFSGAARIWLDAARKMDDPSSWGQVLGALAMILITAESAWKVMSDLTTRDPKPPPLEKP
jgi:hypothetical protein